jgi:hypothetical protein
MFQGRPLSFTDAAFKDRILHSLAMIFTSLSYSAEPPPPGVIDG